MGWLIYSHIPDNIHDEIARILTGPQTTPLKISRVGSTWYAAVQARPTKPPRRISRWGPTAPIPSPP